MHKRHIKWHVSFLGDGLLTVFALLREVSRILLKMPRAARLERQLATKHWLIPTSLLRLVPVHRFKHGGETMGVTKGPANGDQRCVTRRPMGARSGA